MFHHALDPECPPGAFRAGICSSEGGPVLRPSQLFAGCALSSPRPQPDRVGSVKLRKVNVAKEHSAQLQVLCLITGKGKASRSLCSGKSPLPTKRGLLGYSLSSGEIKQASDLAGLWNS